MPRHLKEMAVPLPELLQVQLPPEQPQEMQAQLLLKVLMQLPKE